MLVKELLQKLKGYPEDVEVTLALENGKDLCSIRKVRMKDIVCGAGEMFIADADDVLTGRSTERAVILYKGI